MRVIPKVRSIKISEKGIIKRADIEFKDGLNIILGRGATGKTTVIKAFEEAIDDSPENIKVELLSGRKLEDMPSKERCMLPIEGVAFSNRCFLMDGEFGGLSSEQLNKALKLLAKTDNQVIATLRDRHFKLPQINVNVINTADFELRD